MRGSGYKPKSNRDCRPVRRKCSVCISKGTVIGLLISLKTMKETVSIELCPEHIEELLNELLQEVK